MIEGTWGEQSDDDKGPEDEDDGPPAKKFRGPSPTPSTASSSGAKPSTSGTPPTRYLIQPCELPSLAGLPARVRPVYELRDAQKKSYYCQICGISNGNHNSAITHVRRDHLNLVLACPYCEKYDTPSWETLEKHMGKFHKGLPIQAPPGADETDAALAMALAQEEVTP